MNLQALLVLLDWFDDQLLRHMCPALCRLLLTSDVGRSWWHLTPRQRAAITRGRYTHGRRSQ